MRSLEVRIESLMMPWIDKADEDLELAHYIVSGPKRSRFRGSVGFHCQHAAEKYLKAFLTHVQVEFRKTHDLTALLKLATAAGCPFPVSSEDGEWLTRFGVDVRYPGDAP